MNGSNVIDLTPRLDARIEREQKQRRAIRLLGGGAAGIALITALTATGGETSPSYSKYPATIEEGTIDPGVNLRTEAMVLEDSANGESNACATLEESLDLKPQDVLIARDTDANGDWIGIDPDNAELPESCQDEDTVWVNRNYVKAPLKSDPYASPIEESRD